jgi:hypothetical protein
MTADRSIEVIGGARVFFVLLRIMQERPTPMVICSALTGMGAARHPRR